MGKDYEEVLSLSSQNSGSSKARPQKLIDYWLTRRAAKLLAADVDNERGRAVINYLIDRAEKLEEIKRCSAPVWDLKTDEGLFALSIALDKKMREVRLANQELKL